MSNIPSSSTQNLALWDRVAVTDPGFTKPFQSSQGFGGTAVSPIYNVKKATETFGPIGIGWGYEIVDERFVDGAPLGFDSDGNKWGNVTVHVIRLRLWYMLGEKKGHVEHFGQTTFVGTGEHGLFTDEDAPKKSLTDALGKCLSMLGFSADVYLGHYDDSKYVASIQERFKDKSRNISPALTQQRPAEPPVRAPDPVAASLSNRSDTGSSTNPKAWVERIRTFTDDGLIEHARKEVPKYLKGQELQQVREAIDQHQLATWLKRIPVLSRVNLPALREKAPKTFKDTALEQVMKALEAREATFASIKTGLTNAAAAA